jgi:sulfoacetaldehyde acetyltransferase
MGLGGFQETEQMPIFSKITKWQVHVNSPMRIAESDGRAFDYAMAERGPVQVNIPLIISTAKASLKFRSRSASNVPPAARVADAAAKLLAKAKFPVILSAAA